MKKKVETKKLLNAEFVIFVLPAGRFIFLWGPLLSYSVNLHEGFAVLFLNYCLPSPLAYSNTTGCLAYKTLLCICWINIIFL